MPQANKKYKILSCYFMSWDKDKDNDPNSVTDCEFKGEKNGDYIFSNVDDNRDFATIEKMSWDASPWAEKGEIYPF